MLTIGDRGLKTALVRCISVLRLIVLVVVMTTRLGLQRLVIKFDRLLWENFDICLVGFKTAWFTVRLGQVVLRS